MGTVEPVPDAPAAIVGVGASGRTDRALVVADYHAGLEAGLRQEGVSIPTHATERRNRLCDLLDETGADRVVFLGDLAQSIGDPCKDEREELETLLETVTDRVPVTVVKGNHDGGIERVVERAGIDGVSVTPTEGVQLGSVGFAHGHTWPAPEVVGAPLVCVGHEHPTVWLTDSVGGRRVERVWLRGALDRGPFDAHTRATASTAGSDGCRSTKATSDGGNDSRTIDGELVVFPAFNDLLGGTWVNVPKQDFLAPFLPDGLAGGEAYLLDGTRLGEYRRV